MDLKNGTADEGADDEDTNDDGANEDADDTVEALPKDKKYSILFIGNSYTKRNNMSTDIFLPMAKTAGYDVEVKAILNGGHTLEAFADPNDTYGSLVARELNAKNAGKYDFVILQEQSLRPINMTGKFYDGARALAEKIKAAGATPVLYSTWGRKTGSSDLADLNMTNESMTWTLAANYGAIGKELGVPVAHVGLAFFDVYTNSPRIELYDADLYHPIDNGSYLAAATLFAKIFGVDPTTVDYNGSIRDNYAATLREAAKNAVFNTPEIPEEYRTTSEGVGGTSGEASMMKNLTELPTSKLISVIKGRFPNGKPFSGIRGSKGEIASKEYSETGLTDAQKADIADIGYGVSVIGVERMDPASKGYTTAIENLVNGHWGSSMMSTLVFDDKLYDVSGSAVDNGKYRALITLNFGKNCKFSAVGFASGSMGGFPGAVDVYVSSDGENWTPVPSACWNKIDGPSISACRDAGSLVDPWNSNSTDTVCLFDMAEVEGVYVRLGVIIGRNDKLSMYNTINTREVLVFGEYLQ